MVTRRIDGLYALADLDLFRSSKAVASAVKVARAYPPTMEFDPAVSNPDHYRVLFENERVRVLEYTDHPGECTTPHEHPDSVMVTLSSFSRRLVAGDREIDVEIPFGSVRWLDPQRHHGENTGTTDTHAIFIELKELSPDATDPARRESLGPADA